MKTKKRVCLKCGNPITNSYSMYQQYCFNCWNGDLLKGGYIQNKQVLKKIKMEEPIKKEKAKPKAVQIRELLEKGVSKEEIAKQLGVKETYVTLVIKSNKK